MLHQRFCFVSQLFAQAGQLIRSKRGLITCVKQIRGGCDLVLDNLLDGGASLLIQIKIRGAYGRSELVLEGGLSLVGQILNDSLLLSFRHYL